MQAQQISPQTATCDFFGEDGDQTCGSAAAYTIFDPRSEALDNGAEGFCGVHIREVIEQWLSIPPAEPFTVEPL